MGHEHQEPSLLVISNVVTNVVLQRGCNPFVGHTLEVCRSGLVGSKIVRVLRDEISHYIRNDEKVAWVLLFHPLVP